MDQKNSNQTCWIAHRGLCKTAPENSRAAFRDAENTGFNSIETDLRVSQDGHLLLSHDPDLKRLGGPAQPVWSLKRRDLEAVELNGGEPPLFFDEFVALTRRMNWVFDIKQETGLKTLQALKDWIDQNQSADIIQKSRFLFWDHAQRSWWLRSFPEARIFASQRECWRAGLASLTPFSLLGGMIPSWGYAVPPSLLGKPLFRKKIFKKYQDRKACVIAYLPRSVEEAQSALSAGADFILTDYERL